MPRIIVSEPNVISRMGRLGVTVAHPLGCQTLMKNQIERARREFSQSLSGARGKTALILGSTTFGYGSGVLLAAKSAGFSTVGIGFEKEREMRGEKVKRASPGWYLTGEMHSQGFADRTFFADAFADGTRERVIRDLLATNRKIDLLIYSLAAEKRNYNGQEWKSALKVIGDPLTVMAIDYKSGKIKSNTVEAATPDEIENTRRVMGGEDLTLWANSLLNAGCLREGATIGALSYVGPSHFEALSRLYWNGTIGAAKKDIDQTTARLNEKLSQTIGGKALSIVNPAVVTLASVNIPVIAQYLSAYLSVADEGIGIYNDPLKVGINLVKALYGPEELWKQLLDQEGRLRLDGDEMDPVLQTAIRAEWDANNREADPTPRLQRGHEIFKRTFLQLSGFEVPGVNYEEPCEFDVPLTPEQGVFDLLSKPEAVAPRRQPLPRQPSQAESVILKWLERNGMGNPVMEDGKPVFHFESAISPEHVLQYAHVTGQPQDAIPANYTFVLSFQDIVRIVASDIKERHSLPIHSAEEIHIISPIPVTIDKLQGRVWLRKMIRNGGPVMAIVDREIKNSEGTVLATGRTTLLIGQDLSKLPSIEAKPSDLGGELLSKIMMTQENIDRYAQVSGDDNPIHKSLGVARELGLNSTVAHGNLTLGLANRDNWSSYKAAWKTPVMPGDTIQFRRRPGKPKEIVGLIVERNSATLDQPLLAIELTQK